MGCGPSKEKEEKNKIDFQFKEVTLAKFKGIFDNAAKTLEEAEQIRHNTEDLRQTVIHGTDVDWLKEVKFIEAIRVLIWSISASNKGIIKDAKPAVTESSPFLDFDRSCLKAEQIEIVDALQNYLKTIATSQAKLPEIQKQVEELAANAQEAVKSAHEEAKQAGLPPAKILKEASVIAGNSGKLTKSAEKVKTLPILLKTANEEKGEVIKNLLDLVGSADEIGAKAYKDGLILPKEIFQKFHQGLKKTKAEKHKYDHDHGYGHGHDHKHDQKKDKAETKKEDDHAHEHKDDHKHEDNVDAQVLQLDA